MSVNVVTARLGELIGERKIFVFLGESGAGKSELAINMAMLLAEQGKKVRFFDLDQTKPLFRSRELQDMLREKGVLFDTGRQFMDAPTIAEGVYNRLFEEDVLTVLDVGGNAVGARSLGQLHAAWEGRAAAYMVANCYRPFSLNSVDLLTRMDEVAAAARFGSFEIISNPNFGAETVLADVMDGHAEILAMAQKSSYRVAALTASPEFAAAVLAEWELPVIEVRRFIRAPWEKIIDN